MSSINIIVTTMGCDDYLVIDSRPPLRAFSLSTTRTSMAPLLPQERRRATKPVAPFVMRKAHLWVSHPLRRQEQASRRPPPPPPPQRRQMPRAAYRCPQCLPTLRDTLIINLQTCEHQDSARAVKVHYAAVPPSAYAWEAPRSNDGESWACDFLDHASTKALTTGVTAKHVSRQPLNAPPALSRGLASIQLPNRAARRQTRGPCPRPRVWSCEQTKGSTCKRSRTRSAR